MKLTLPWLKEHLATEAPVPEIAERLTALGFEVEGIMARGADLSALKVAEVLATQPHPQAERLRLCTVEAGSGPLEVVCGAANVRPGLKVVFAPVGAIIPESGRALERVVIRGIASNGMICSARELLLGDDHDGILELPDDAPVGRPAAEAIRVEGPVLDVNVTPNRGDCFGVLGLARELAASGLGQLRSRNFTSLPGQFRTDLKVRFELPEGEAHACPLFVARAFRGLRNGPSPAWLRERLTAIGLRPISTLVDITNLITYDLGRPLHVFDAAKLQGDLVLRFARPGEALAALDGKTYQLQDGMTVIADERGPVSLGGIIGGEASGCTEVTTEVILEVALFGPRRTARTGRALGIESDARTRFERGLDPKMVLPATEYASRLILELCGGEASEPVVAGAVPAPPPAFAFRIAQLERLIGIPLDLATIQTKLRMLGFDTALESDEVMRVAPPSWRHDIALEADIVEELARLHGYDRIPPMPVRRTTAVGHPALAPEQRQRALARRTAAAQGLSEAVTWSFTEPGLAAHFGTAALRLRNPISAELAVLRPSLLPNLLEAAARNQNRGLSTIALFELGPRFHGSLPGEQELALGGLRLGPVHERHWAVPTRPADVYDARGDALAILTACRINAEGLRVVADGPGHYHPGRRGRLLLGPTTVLAEFGELHPAILKERGLDGRAVAFELFLDRLPRPKARAGRKLPLKASPFPAVERDFAFVVAEQIGAETLLAAVRAADKGLIREVALFDVYRGQGLAAGQKSLAVSVRLQAADHTLSEAEIEAVVRRITAAAGKAAGAVLRA
jgi:phenylalanyl-tRNA synthetase beta chain